MIEHPFLPGYPRVPNTDLPLPKVGVIDLWRIDLNPGAASLETCRCLLDPEELERAARFRFDRHRRRFVVRRAQLRRLLGAYLSLSPREVHFELGKRGKPKLAKDLIARLDAPLEFNLSDSEDEALVGVQLGEEIGVDVEVVKEMPDALAIAKHNFAESEQQVLARQPPDRVADTFFRCWTRKEAYIKAIGEGLALPLDSFEVTMTEDTPSRFLSFRGHPGEENRWSLTHFEPSPGIFVAVATRREGPRFQCFELAPLAP